MSYSDWTLSGCSHSACNSGSAAGAVVKLSPPLNRLSLNMHAGKVVLVSSTPYTAAHGEVVLRQLVDDKIELFCAVGVDAAKWEHALDWLCIGSDGESVHFVVTTSHPEESVEDVIIFAEAFRCKCVDEVEVIYV